MPLVVPKDLSDAIASVKSADHNSYRWCVWGYVKSNTLKLVATGQGDYTELTDAKNLCQDSELQYGLTNSPDGVKTGFVEWTGSGVGGMKRSYMLRNHGQIDKLIGYVHHRFSSDGDQDKLKAEIHALGIYEGGALIGEVKGWQPDMQEYLALWAEVDPVKGWDPSTQWIYKWNPYGIFSLGNLPEEDKEKFKQFYKRCEGVPEEILDKGLLRKIKQLCEAEKDEDIPKFTEDEAVILSRLAGIFEKIDARDDTGQPNKLKKHDPGTEFQTKKNETKKFKPIDPDPESDDPEPSSDEELPDEEDPVPDPVDELPAPDSDDPDPLEDPDEKTYYVYSTSLGQNAQTASQVYQVKMILDLHKIKYEEVDLYLDGLAGGTRRSEMTAKSGSRVLPQIFINDKYLEGGFDEFMWLNEIGEL